jgi:hypothetical protein
MKTAAARIASTIDTNYVTRDHVILTWHNETFELDRAASTMHALAIRAAEKLASTDEDIVRRSAQLQRELDCITDGIKRGIHVTNSIGRIAAEIDHLTDLRSERATTLRAILNSI